MKKLSKLYLGLSMAFAATASLFGLSSCQADMETPELKVPVATMVPNTTISDFKTAFADTTVLCPLKDEASKTPYIIHGRIISSDASGNIYKSIIIQDETAAITLSVNQSSTYAEYRLGQEIVVNATGLYIGYYNGLQQLGWLGAPYNGVKQLGFMAWDLFLGHTEMNGLPNPNTVSVAIDGTWPSDSPYCVVSTFDKLPALGAEFRNMQSQLVEFRNVSFVEGGKETYAPYQESVNRTLKDASGATLTVRTSGYSNFYQDTIPEGSGTVRGILSYYGSGWQLLLRGKGDVMITKKGQKVDPYTIEEAMQIENQGTFGWVKGYIVGSVKAGVQKVESAADVTFKADETELQNNILIAASATETDYKKCIAVSLPAGSDFRKAVNLLDNPQVLGKSILVNGVFADFLGLPGLIDNAGTGADVEVEGVTIGGGSGTTTDGDGTKERPYSVTQIAAMTTAVTGVWVEGYVAGYVPAMTWNDAVFGTTATEGSTNYTNATNIVLSSVAPTASSLTNSIPVGLATQPADVRATLGISKNPSIYGKKVLVKGDAQTYFGKFGLKNVTEYVVDDAGGGSGGGGGENPPSGEITPKGDGTEASPYNIAAIKAKTPSGTTVLEENVWVVGYVVGYVPSAKWAEVVFGGTDIPASYTNTNMVLSDVSTGCSSDNSIPCQLPASPATIRTSLGLVNNPAIYLKKVMVKGNIANYFNVPAIKSISEYKEL